MGRPEEALRSFRRALSLREGLPVTDPDWQARQSWNAFMNASNKKRRMATSTNDTPACWTRVIAPPKLERATGSLRDLWRSRLAGLND